MLLQNFDFFNKYYDTDVNKELKSTSNLVTMGLYKIIDGHVCRLEVEKQKLYFKWDKIEFEIEDNHRVIIKKTDYSNIYNFNLYLDDEQILNFNYNSDISYNHISPWEYIDDEDTNWGLFLSNLINNHSRRNSMIEILMSKIL